MHQFVIWEELKRRGVIGDDCSRPDRMCYDPEGDDGPWPLPKWCQSCLIISYVGRSVSRAEVRLAQRVWNGLPHGVKIRIDTDSPAIGAMEAD